MSSSTMTLNSTVSSHYPGLIIGRMNPQPMTSLSPLSTSNRTITKSLSGSGGMNSSPTTRNSSTGSSQTASTTNTPATTAPNQTAATSEASPMQRLIAAHLANGGASSLRIESAEGTQVVDLSKYIS